MGAGALAQVLRQLPRQSDENLLVGLDASDDAAVYRVSDELAIVTSVDFFPPIVDDPFSFGEISAANALSDIYAMGAAPRFATAIVCFPPELDVDILAEIMKGSAGKLREAGALLVGGHSIEDREIKYGLSVTGFVHPKEITTNGGARPGDALVLTKPLGTGVITSALKGGRLAPDEAGEAFLSMKTLNMAASNAMKEAGASACTDVTGFGLIGHAHEMAEASGVSLVIRAGLVPLLPHAAGLVAKKKNRPRAIKSNMEFFSGRVEMDGKVDEATELLLYDPQTSGGLLIATAGDTANALIEALAERRVIASVVGEAVERDEKWSIRVVE